MLHQRLPALVVIPRTKLLLIFSIFVQTHFSLSLIDLWLFPTKVAAFLSSLNFPDLAPLPPLLPPPPPKPPTSPPNSPSAYILSPLSLSDSLFDHNFSPLDQSLGSIIPGSIA